MTDTPKRSPMALFLDLIEKVGNKLPDPITLFAGGALFVLVLSHVGERAGWEVDKPVGQPKMEQVLDSGTGEPVQAIQTEIAGRKVVLVTDENGIPVAKPVTQPVLSDQGQLQLVKGSEPVRARSLLTREGFKWVLDNLVDNFTHFHPLGVVLVAMLGIGVAEKTKLIDALLKAMALITPSKLLNPAMVFIGVMSSMAADAGYVVLPPIAALLYKSVGRSPLVGIAAVFAGVAAGFSANLVVTSLDPLLSGLTQVGANIVDPTYEVLPTANYAFMVVSTFLLTFVGWFVTSRFVEPRFAGKPASEGGPSEVTEEERAAAVLTDTDKSGMVHAGIWGGVTFLAAAALIFIPGAPLYAYEGEGPRWGHAIVPILFFVFLACGLGFGLKTGTLLSQTGAKRKDTALAKMMGATMADMAPYIVLAFFAAQFVEFFNHSNLGVMLAVVGGNFLSQIALPPQALMALFIVVAMVGNLFIGSASAKYAFFAPVFVPMFMAVGISPELTQAAYRVGDSCTNIITPLNPYFVVILVFVQKYAPKAGIGTLVSMMMPYTVVFWLVWTVVLLAWMTLGFPLGPGGPIHYEAAF
ncbi:MAG: AbgT family transporter [Myxococcota bacterium]|nr:AbgT family transporter [Myxococcota bacterium]